MQYMWHKFSLQKGKCLVLDQVIQGMPNVISTPFLLGWRWTQYKDKILPVLEIFLHSNFHYLGSLEYPDKVRIIFGTEIDVYALKTGMDTTILFVCLVKRETMAIPIKIQFRGYKSRRHS